MSWPVSTSGFDEENPARIEVYLMHRKSTTEKGADDPITREMKVHSFTAKAHRRRLTIDVLTGATYSVSIRSLSRTEVQSCLPRLKP